MSVTVRAVQHAVAARFGVPLAAMNSVARHRMLCRPRQVAIFLAYRLTPASSTALGRAFSRDHSTVLYAVRVTAQRMTSDAALAATVAELETGLGIERPGRHTEP